MASVNGFAISHVVATGSATAIAMPIANGGCHGQLPMAIASGKDPRQLRMALAGVNSRWKLPMVTALGNAMGNARGNGHW